MTVARRILAAAAAAALGLSAAGAAAADEVRLKDGRTLEGKVLEDGPGGVKIRLRFGGEVSFPRSEVASVERKDLPEEAIAKKRAALAADDAAGRWALAQEAKAQRLKKVHDELVAEVLRLDPGHREANEAAGNVLFEGKWVKAGDRDRLAAEKEKAEKEAAGLVLHEGKWITPEERDALQRGLVKKDGRWMTLREAMELEGKVEYKGGWVRKEELEALRLRDNLTEAAGVPLTVAQSERFSVATVYPQKATDQFLADAEKAFQEFAALYGLAPGTRIFDDPFNGVKSRCHVVVLEKADQYERFLDGLLRIHRDLAKVLKPERVDLMKKQKGFYLVDPDCWIVGYQFPYPQEQMRHTVVHKLSHVMLVRSPPFRGTAWLGWWLLEGLGEMQEINAFGNCQVYCITTGYGEAPGSAKTIGESWKVEAKKLVTAGGDRALREIVVRSLNELEPWDLVKCWSFVHYLAALDRENLVKLTLLLKEKVPASEAMPKVYGATVDEMEQRWRDFVRRTY
jgi:hypothetical protein